MSRRSKQEYFPPDPEAPPPLTWRVKRRVRFEEIDPLNIVWHGRYPSYIEDGRTAFGGQYGLSYLLMYREKFMAPIIQMHIDYHSPLTFPEECTIVTQLHWSESVRLNFQYSIIGENGKVATTGYTVQLLTDLNNQVLLVRPKYIEKFCQRWKENLLQ